MWTYQQERSLVMKILSIAAIASVAFAGNAMATDSLWIESEAQFVRDYGDQIQQIGPGVYQIISGEMTGKSVAIGEAGLNYDLSTQRSLATNMSRSSSAKANSDALIQKLEEQKARYAQLRMLMADNENAKAGASGGAISCTYRPFNGNPIWYNGYVNVFATTEFYLDRGNGTLNWYFARAGASASGYVFQPYNVPTSFSLFADAYAQNTYTGQSIGNSIGGFTSVNAGTGGYVYSGPSFSHNMDAYASVRGTGNCFGYVAISDSMRP
jgi:hypothetical protein